MAGGTQGAWAGGGVGRRGCGQQVGRVGLDSRPGEGVWGSGMMFRLGCSDVPWPCELRGGLGRETAIGAGRGLCREAVAGSDELGACARTP